jgi:N-acetylglutamate synthase-like GNAT family acetyltransferase
MIEVIEYEDRYAFDFKKINLEWLDKYNLTEPPDLLMLSEPQTQIIKPGGAVYLARVQGEIIGSAALINEHDGVYELAKMTVIPAWQGKGISKLLLEKCLEKARALQARKIILFSSHKLDAALRLYTRYGFVNVEVTDSPFLTADIKMELHLR